MRLLNVHTLNFQEFFDKDIPPYCILSHRWGEQETSYKDFSKGRNPESSGYRKVIDFCDFAKSRQKVTSFDWVWIDTCCIDKRSSAELTESINSMYRYYADALECFVHLADVPTGSRISCMAEMKQSSWFTRGWTLRELLAPNVMLFCDSSWQVFGHICKGNGSVCPHAIDRIQEVVDMAEDVAENEQLIYIEIDPD